MIFTAQDMRQRKSFPLIAIFQVISTLTAHPKPFFDSRFSSQGRAASFYAA